MMKKLFLPLLIMFMGNPLFTFGQEWSKKFVKQDVLYMKGDYKLARELNHNLKIKIKTTLGPQNPYTALAQFKDAKYHAGAGYIQAYRRSVNSGLSIARGATGRKNINYARIALEGIQIMVKYGDYARAETLLNEVSDILVDYKNKDPKLEHKKNYLLAQVYAAQEHRTKALDMLIKLRDYAAELTLETEVKDNFTSGNKDKTRTLSAFELKQNKRTYAHYLTLIGQLYAHSHESGKADSAFNVARVWINNNLPANDYSQIYYQFQQIKIAEEKDPNEKNITQLANLVKRSEKTLNRNQELVLDMKYTLLNWYQKNNNTAKYNGLKTHLTNINEKYYDNKNIHLDLLALTVLGEESEEKSDQDKINEAKKMLKNSAALPDVHESRIKVLLFLLEKSEEAGQETESEAYFKQIQDQKTELYGEGSPVLSS
ncbi:hypothetical protein QQ020_30815 [Fulvivirgaceae bacterium BMA12]|uniref:Tetratricopeptide repeat protein n=1 Tax=Agaribacillus aureus TaxID=3051825 RepID=A0ABT8LJD5_9BACT|nr:hypothetical protein [Fulvivirgaceae bacterium BMA12]